jgi:hypothetical protein
MHGLSHRASARGSGTGSTAEGTERCLTNLHLFWHLSQLAAGSEHVIAGKTVRVNAAGPRPELPLLYLQQGRLQQPMGPPPPAAGESPLTLPLCAPAVFLQHDQSMEAKTPGMQHWLILCALQKSLKKSNGADACANSNSVLLARS